MVLAIVTSKLYWLRMVLRDLDGTLSSSSVVWCDNQSDLALAKNPIFHAKAKDIEVDYHFLHEKVLSDDIIIRHVSTLEQIADIFTKGNTANRFLFIHSKFLLEKTMIKFNQQLILVQILYRS